MSIIRRGSPDARGWRRRLTPPPALPVRPRAALRRAASAVAVAAGVAIAGAVHLGATTVLPAGFEEMVRGSQAIVYGRVLDVRSQADAGRGSIETVVTLAVVESFKGDDGPVAVFRVPGGRIGRYRRIVVGAPSFAAGDEVVLFLRGRAPAVPVPFGLTQGVYRVARDRQARALVVPLVADGPGRLVRGDPARRPLPLETFAQRVRAIAGAR